MQELRLDNIFHWLPFMNGTSLDLRNVKWCEPIAIGVIKSLKLLNPTLEIIKPHDKDLNCYFNVIESEQNSEYKTYMPLKTINVYSRGEVEKISYEIVSKILRNTFSDSIDKDYDFVRDYKDYLNYMINEVLLNAVSHSESKTDIVVFAQHYSKYRKTQVVIVDCGIGFKATISRRYKVENDANALERAIEKGVTGAQEYSYQSSIRNVGIGLYALRKMIEKLNGNLVLISYNGFLQISSNSLFCKNYTQKLWNGSIVAFEFDTEEINFDFLKFMELYVYPEEETEEDIF
ncbi:hypothetical protein [Thermodesulfovibrio yellowstonii]|uniref:Histidine kinase/HSP90-like ATPase domain-containing protein n=1 Tax=Thermodesulfovibrio yellowstonii TaxID=28262 RepID=A0A9W6LL93_9BACT|nr:hypothetical protein [Thermodesulfovibrio islandicus]GLI54469.1 hypothetical protein TISLANDTSLP1_21620 [Thermodesulfovibrio islandicus]